MKSMPRLLLFCSKSLNFTHCYERAKLFVCGCSRHCRFITLSVIRCVFGVVRAYCCIGRLAHRFFVPLSSTNGLSYRFYELSSFWLRSREVDCSVSDLFVRSAFQGLGRVTCVRICAFIGCFVSCDCHV